MTAAPAVADRLADRAASGAALSPAEAMALATADLFLLGAAADASRARLHGDACRLVAVRRFRWDGAPADPPPPPPAPGSAPETPDELRFEVDLPAGATARDVAAAVAAARSAHPGVPVRAVRPAELPRLAATSGLTPAACAAALAAAGVALLAHPRPADDAADTLAGLTALRGGAVAFDAPLPFGRDTPPRDLAATLLGVRLMVGSGFPVRAVVPLPDAPPEASPLEGTTGTDDLRAFALARLLAPDALRVVVEVGAVGAKLGAVALSFGADTLAGVEAEPTPRLTAADGERPRPFNAPRARLLLAEVGRVAAAAAAPAPAAGRP